MALMKMPCAVGTGGNALTPLWENSSTSSLSSGTIQVPDLDKYDTVIFELMNSSDNSLYYSGIKLSDLATAKDIGYILPQSNYYVFWRQVTHSAPNTLTISTGYYSYQGGGVGNGDGYAVFLKIYGLNAD